MSYPVERVLQNIAGWLDLIFMKVELENPHTQSLCYI